MAATIEIKCRVQYLRKGKWVTINKEDGIVATIENDLVEEVERLKALGRLLLAEYEQSEHAAAQEFATDAHQWDDVWAQIEKWKEELA